MADGLCLENNSSADAPIILPLRAVACARPFDGNQSDVTEGLRIVAKKLPRGGMDLFRQEPEAVGATAQTTEELVCLVNASL